MDSLLPNSQRKLDSTLNLGTREMKERSGAQKSKASAGFDKLTNKFTTLILQVLSMVTKLHCSPILVICGWTAVAVSVLRQYVHESTLKAMIGTLAGITPSASIELEAQEKY